MTIQTICDAVVELTVRREWDLVALDDEGNWQVLASELTYEDADHKLDVYTDQYPHAIVDIIPHKSNA